MGLHAWWLKTRLSGIEQKVKKLRSKQRHLRTQADELAKEKKRQGETEALRQKEAKLQAERERVTTQVSELLAQEEEIKRQMERAHNDAARTAEG